MAGHLLDLIDIPRRQSRVDTGGESKDVVGAGFSHALDGETDTLTLPEAGPANRPEDPVLKDRIHYPLHKPPPSDADLF
jgi:hypothetical protein